MTLLLRTIFGSVAELSGIEPARLADRRAHGRPLSLARSRAWWICRQLRPDESYQAIARVCGGFNHTSVIYAVSAAAQRIRDSAQERRLVQSWQTAISPHGPMPLIQELSPRDRRLVAAALAGRSIELIADATNLPVDVAHERVTQIAQALAAALGRGLISADLYSHKPDALHAVEIGPAEPPPPLLDPFTLPAPPFVPFTPEEPPPVEAPAEPPRRAAPRTPPRELAAPPAPPRAPRPARRPAAPTTPSRTAPPRVFAALGTKPPPPAPVRATVSDTDRALIEAAVAAGKVRQVGKDDGTELVYDPDTHAYARFPREELVFVPGSGWRKPPRTRHRAKPAPGAQPNASPSGAPL